MEASGTSRDEGGAERRAQLLDPRRLVGGGVLRRNCGFAIGATRSPPSEAEQDAADAEALYAVLEQQVLPAYYERDAARAAAALDRADAGVDRRARRRASATDRMVAEYVERLYLPAHSGERSTALAE